MEYFFWFLVLLITFLTMEFMAWFSHKYIMHGFLWVLHKDHHKKNHNSWFEKNDLFFIFYAVVSSVFVIMWGEYNFWPGLPIGIGIFCYGLTYFFIHDIFIHQRFKWFKKTKSQYLLALRKGHKVHHKYLDKYDGESFGMLIVPFKYFREQYNRK